MEQEHRHCIYIAQIANFTKFSADYILPSGISMFEYQKVALHECYPLAIVDKTIAKPPPPNYISPYELNTNKIETSNDSVQPICTVRTSMDSSFSVLSNTVSFVSVLLARAKISSIYWRPLEVRNSKLGVWLSIPFTHTCA